LLPPRNAQAAIAQQTGEAPKLADFRRSQAMHLILQDLLFPELTFWAIQRLHLRGSGEFTGGPTGGNEKKMGLVADDR
jgi:hypothetical protein